MQTDSVTGVLFRLLYTWINVRFLRFRVLRTVEIKKYEFSFSLVNYPGYVHNVTPQMSSKWNTNQTVVLLIVG